MAPRAKIDQLPEDILEELDKRLVESGYSDIDGHYKWLTGEIDRLGVEAEEPVSRSAVGRYSRMRKLQHMSIEETVRELKAFEQEFGDDPTLFIQSGNNMAQSLAWKRLLAAKNGDVSVDEDFLKDISLSLGRMAKTAAINEKRERDIRDDERQLAREAAAAAVEKVSKASGTSHDTIELMRKAIMEGMSG